MIYTLIVGLGNIDLSLTEKIRKKKLLIQAQFFIIKNLNLLVVLTKIYQI